MVHSLLSICPSVWSRMINRVETCTWCHYSSLWCTICIPHAFSLYTHKAGVGVGHWWVWHIEEPVSFCKSMLQWDCERRLCRGWQHQGAATLLIISNVDSKCVEKRQERAGQSMSQTLAVTWCSPWQRCEIGVGWGKGGFPVFVDWIKEVSG